MIGSPPLLLTEYPSCIRQWSKLWCVYITTNYVPAHFALCGELMRCSMQATWGTSSEHSDNTALASAITLPGCGQAGPSDVPAEPKLGQKLPGEPSPCAESLNGSNANRFCQGSLYTYTPLADDSSPQEHLNPRIPGSKMSQSSNDAGHEERREGPGTTADWTWSGNTGDGVAIVSEPEVVSVHITNRVPNQR